MAEYFSPAGSTDTAIGLLGGNGDSSTSTGTVSEYMDLRSDDGSPGGGLSAAGANAASWLQQAQLSPTRSLYGGSPSAAAHALPAGDNGIGSGSVREFSAAVIGNMAAAAGGVQ